MFSELNFMGAAFLSKAIRFVICIACLVSIVSAQDVGPKTTKPSDGDNGTTKRLSDMPLVLGTVENKDGHTVSNAKIWLIGGKYNSPEVLGETTSDDQGQFAFNDLADEDTVFKSPGTLDVWARHPSEGLGWFSGLHNHKRKPMRIELSPTATFTGQLVDRAGQPLPNVKITPTFLSTARLNDNRAIGVTLFPEISQRLSTTTTADGKFEIDDLPVDGLIMCNVAAPGFEQLRVAWNLHKPIVTKIDPGVSFFGRVIWPAEVQIPTEEVFEFGTVTLSGYSLFEADGIVASDREKAVYAAQNTYSVPIDQKGQFRLDHLAPGQYYVSAKLSQRLPLLQPESEQLDVKPGTETNELKLVAEKAFKVSGRVVGFENQIGIAQAVVRFSNIVDGMAIHRGQTTTDKDGKYFAYVKKGKNQFTVSDAPQEFIPMADTYDSEFAAARKPMIEVNEDTVWPDLILDPACDVTIEVFDENGKPAAGAFVKIVAAAGYPAGKDYQNEQRTDAKGKYIIRRVTVNDTLPICVRTPTAISKLDLVITPSELNEPVRIDLSADIGFRCRCRVVDRDGEPITNANVSVGTYFFFVTKWSDAERRSALFGSAGAGVTDSDGYFESGPLWPDRDYRLTVKAEGYDQSETPRVNGKDGEVVELKSIVLSTIKAAKIAGVVVDSAKRPVEGVRVFAAGSGYTPATTRTDALGQFELNEVAPDVRYVFADGGAEYRFSGARLGNQQPLQITIRPIDSPPQGIRKIRMLPRDEQLTVANDLFEQVWSLPANVQNTSQYELLRAMVQIDPKRAIEKALAIGRGFENYVLAEQAICAVDEDPERALQFLQPVRNRTGISTSIALGMKLAKSEHEQAKQMANKFADFALKLTAGNTNYNSQLAILFTSLGEPKKAQALIEDVLKPIDMENLTEEQKSTLIQLALAIAPYDFEKARSFASLAKEGHSRTYAMADVAVAIVATDHEKAIREIEALTGDSNAPNIRDKARFRAAWLLVATHPELAIKLVHQCEDDGNRAQALGRLAVRVAEFDQPQAWKMIDAVFAIYRINPDAYRSWSGYGGAGTFAAALAYHAQQVDYPDMESVIWYVLAACRANADRGQDRLEATVKTARILALVDKIAARDLLNAVDHNSDQFPRDEGSDSLYDQWLQAWLLVDFGRGAKLLSDEMDELKNSDQKAKQNYGHGQVFRLLVAPPEDWYKLLLRETGLWKLEEDGTMEIR